MNPLKAVFLKTLAFTAILLTACIHLLAQKKDDTAGTEKKWYIQDAFPANETQSLAIYEHKTNENGIVLVNNMGAIQWEQPFDGCVIAISKYNNHFLVFYAKKGSFDRIYRTSSIKQINAATIDIKSQKIIDDKVIYTGSERVAPDVQNDPAGNFSQLLLRKANSWHSDTKGFTLVTFNADGSAATKEITSIATGQPFIGTSAGKDGSFFISSIQNWSSVVVEKFSHEGVLISKLESPLDTRKDLNYGTILRTDVSTNNAVTVTIKALNSDKDYAFSYFRFNFDDNQVGAVHEAALTKKSSPYNFGNFRDLLPIDILFTNDKVIVVREVQSYELNGSSHTVTYSAGNAVVSIFDKQMKLQREIIVGKHSATYSFIDLGLSCRINNDKLFILAGENAGFGTYDNFCYKVNLNEGSYERKKIGTNKPAMTVSLSTQSTIWFKDEFIITHLHIAFGSGPGRYSSVLERVGFDTL